MPEQKLLIHVLNGLRRMNDRMRIMFMLLAVTLAVHAAQSTVPLTSNDTTYTTVIVRASGQGTVLPDYNGQLLKIGSLVIFRTQPASAYIWAGWTGSQWGVAESCYTCDCFVVRPGLELVAHFAPNPFPPVQGQYNGLVCDTNDASHERSGNFALTLAANGGLTGKFVIGGHSYPVGGGGYKEPVHADGSVQLRFYRGDIYAGDFRHVMTAELQFDLTNGTDEVSGTLSDAHAESRWVGGVKDWFWVPATWTSELAGDRAVFKARANPAPQAGTYTLIFPGGSDGQSAAGAGFGSVSVDSSGMVRITGFLADGLSVRQKVALSKSGRWPFYATLHGGRGSILGWMKFASSAEAPLTGMVTWTRPALAGTALYPSGFVVKMECVGSPYQRPEATTSSLLNFSAGAIAFSGDGLGEAFSNRLTLAANGKVTNLSSNKLSLSFVTATGLFKGKIVEPSAARNISFKGAVLQDRNVGYGFFLGTNQSGLVCLGPE